jgi:hypothetical protein
VGIERAEDYASSTAAGDNPLHPILKSVINFKGRGIREKRGVVNEQGISGWVGSGRINLKRMVYG